MGPSVLVWQSFHGWILSPASIIISPFGKFRRKSGSFMVFLSFFLRNLPFNLCPNVRFKMVYFPICKWTLEVVPMEHRWGLEALTCSAERSMPLPILIEHQETCHTASVLHHNISFFDNMATYGNIWQQYNQVLICSHHMRFPSPEKVSQKPSHPMPVWGSHSTSKDLPGVGFCKDPVSEIRHGSAAKGPTPLVGTAKQPENTPLVIKRSNWTSIPNRKIIENHLEMGDSLLHPIASDCYVWLPEGHRTPRNIATTATTMDRVCSPHQSPEKHQVPMFEGFSGEA